MELKSIHKEVHSKPITALTFNPLRREVITGCEDGSIRVWEAESGKTVQNLLRHHGWITCLYYWHEAKLLVSSSNDGLLITWGSGSEPHQEISVNNPIYCVAWNSKREQIVIGLNKSVKVFGINGTTLTTPYLNEKCETVTHHTDLVRSIVCIESRIYTGSFDRALIMYETSSYPNDRGLHLISSVKEAHSAAITCLKVISDHESNTWQILSGSFDRSVKVWTQDIQLIHKIDGLSGTVTSLDYVPRSKVLWVLCGQQEASLFDPKSGENITEYVSTRTQYGSLADYCTTNKYHLVHTVFVPELNEVYCTTNRRTVLVWKYNWCAPVTTLQTKSTAEGLAFTGKSPILIFTGDSEGRVTIWEQLQLNNFMYSCDTFSLQDVMTSDRKRSLREMNNEGHRSISKMIFIEQLDILVAASEDGCVYLWGFDDQALDELRDSVPGGSEVLQTISDDPVTNRVAGFTCKQVFSEHTHPITGVAYIPPRGMLESGYLLTCSTDRTIGLWDMHGGTFVGYIGNKDTESEAIYASTDSIMDIAYAASRSEFAYSSTDKLIYIRVFSCSPANCTLKHVLQGHESEVSHVIWNDVLSLWVSGGDDCTVRTWEPSNNGYLDVTTNTIDTQCPVTALAADAVNGSILVGLQDSVRVYEGETLKPVQHHTGHTDSVRAILHIPERSHYITTSWDGTISIWNATKNNNRNGGISSNGH